MDDGRRWESRIEEVVCFDGRGDGRSECGFLRVERGATLVGASVLEVMAGDLMVERRRKIRGGFSMKVVGRVASFGNEHHLRRRKWRRPIERLAHVLVMDTCAPRSRDRAETSDEGGQQAVQRSQSVMFSLDMAGVSS